MADLAHVFGSDLTIDAAGNLALSDGAQATKERILRRLLTNSTDYLWHLEYGAGLAALIGQPSNIGTITAIVRQQMRLESSVVQTPPPTVSVVSAANDAVIVNIAYIDADTGETQTLIAPVA